MKTKTNKTLLAAALTLSLFSNNTYAVDIVNDPAHMAETVAGWGSQLQKMKEQFDQLKSTYESITGNRGFGAMQTLSNAARNYLPKNTGDMQGVIDGASATYGAMSGQVQAFTNQNSILTPGAITNLKMNANQLKLFTQRRKNNAAIQATAAQSMAAASQRFNYIQQLMNKVNATNDEKGIAELNARIAGEQAMLQNDQTKMQQMYAYLQNQEQVNQQQMRELAIQQVGSISALQQPDLSIVNNNH